MNFRLLTNIHHEIIKHLKNDELLDNSQIQIYLNVISKMNLKSEDHLNLAKFVKISLEKIYNENEKSKTENTDNLWSSRHLYKTQNWETTNSEQKPVVKMPYNSSSDNESFDSDMLSGKDFIENSQSLKTTTKLNIPSPEYNYSKNTYQLSKNLASNDLRTYSLMNGLEDAHLNSKMILNTKEISDTIKNRINQGKPSKFLGTEIFMYASPYSKSKVKRASNSNQI